jgi:hypothetical protein
MTQKDQLIALFLSFGLTQGTNAFDKDFDIFENTRESTTTVRLHEGKGYSGFIAEFTFDPDGKFVSHGVWE